MQRQLVLWFMDDCQSENSELFVGDDQGGLAGAERSYRQFIDRAAYLSNLLPRGDVPYHRPPVATAADHPPSGNAATAHTLSWWPSSTGPAPGAAGSQISSHPRTRPNSDPDLDKAADTLRLCEREDASKVATQGRTDDVNLVRANRIDEAGQPFDTETAKTGRPAAHPSRYAR
jgi:hypothetical protein